MFAYNVLSIKYLITIHTYIYQLSIMYSQMKMSHSIHMLSIKINHFSRFAPFACLVYYVRFALLTCFARFFCFANFARFARFLLPSFFPLRTFFRFPCFFALLVFSLRSFCSLRTFCLLVSFRFYFPHFSFLLVSITISYIHS